MSRIVIHICVLVAFFVFLNGRSSASDQKPGTQIGTKLKGPSKPTELRRTSKCDTCSFCRKATRPTASHFR